MHEQRAETIVRSTRARSGNRFAEESDLRWPRIMAVGSKEQKERVRPRNWFGLLARAPKERTRNIPIRYNYRIIPMLAHIGPKEPEIRLIRGYRSQGSPLPEFNQLLYRYREIRPRPRMKREAGPRIAGTTLLLDRSFSL